MLFIPLVELIVGGLMSKWPRVVLNFIFTFLPTSFSVGALASFLYVNGLPRSMALHLVRVCHDGVTDTMLDQVDNLFNTWATSSDIHLATYWNLRLQTFVWVNGPNGPRNEFLVQLYTGGDPNGIETGFTLQQHAAVIRKLYYLRRKVQIW